MRFLIAAVVVFLLTTGAVWANEDFEGWGTPYYYQVIDVRVANAGDTYAAGCTTRASACASGCDEQLSCWAGSSCPPAAEFFELDSAWAWMFE